MTLYEILQVTEKAEKEVIASAYKGLVKKYHPDVSKSPDAERKMTEINNAYAVLSDPVKRSTYDQKLQSERNARHTSTAGSSSHNNQTYNTGVKKEYVRPQPPKTEQKSETPPPRNTNFDKNTTSSHQNNVSGWTSKFFTGINQSISQSKYAKLGIYSSINKGGDLEIVDVGKRSFFNQIRFIVSFFFSVICFMGIIMGWGRLSPITETELPSTILFLIILPVCLYSTFILRPKRYKLIFSKNYFTITLHKFFSRTISYSNIFYSEISFGDPSFVKIHLKNGKKLKSLRYSNAMEIVHEIIGVMIKNRG